MPDSKFCSYFPSILTTVSSPWRKDICLLSHLKHVWPITGKGGDISMFMWLLFLSIWKTTLAIRPVFLNLPNAVILSVPCVVVTCNHKIILLLLHYFPVVMNCNVSIWYATLKELSVQAENRCIWLWLECWWTSCIRLCFGSSWGKPKRSLQTFLCALPQCKEQQPMMNSSDSGSACITDTDKPGTVLPVPLR